MALSVSQLLVGPTARLVGTVQAPRRVIIATFGGAGVYLGKDATVSSTTGFLLGASTSSVDYPLVLDLQAGDSLYAISAKNESQVVCYIAYVPLAGV